MTPGSGCGARSSTEPAAVLRCSAQAVGLGRSEWRSTRCTNKRCTKENAKTAAADRAGHGYPAATGQASLSDGRCRAVTLPGHCGPEAVEGFVPRFANCRARLDGQASIVEVTAGSAVSSGPSSPITKRAVPPCSASVPNSSSSASGRLMCSWMTRAMGLAPISGS